MFKQHLMQIKREFWENKTLLFVFPSTLAIIAIIALVGTTVYKINSKSVYAASDNTQWHFDSQLDADRNSMQQVDSDFYDPDIHTQQKRLNNGIQKTIVINDSESLVKVPKNNGSINLVNTKDLNVGLQVIFVLFAMTLLSSGMNRDRNDGSIYFWRSLPVSETRHVLTKLFVATIILPVIYFTIIALTFTLIVSLIGVNDWLFLADNLQNKNLLGDYLDGLHELFFSLLVTFFILVLALPILGWSMLFSSLINRYAQLIMLIPIAILMLVEWLTLGSGHIRDALMSYFYSAMNMVLLMRMEFTISPEFYQLLPIIALGAVFIASSIWVRRWKIE